MNSKVYATLSFWILCIGVGFSQQALQILERADFSIGESLTIKSEILEEDRKINIYLPQSYATNPEKKYPIIYLLDGSADEDFIHIVGLIQFLSFSWIDAVPESIVVGISNIDRKKDFTYPTTNEKDKIQFPTTGGSEAFINFVEAELQPTIKSNYRTAEPTTLIGQSLGGLLATEILFKHPHLFTNYVIVSPSLWWDDESLFKALPSSIKGNKSVSIAVGAEGEVMENLAYQLHALLIPFKSDQFKLNFQLIERLDHGDTLHLAAYDALERIFAKQK